jgi:hypothetical protein
MLTYYFITTIISLWTIWTIFYQFQFPFFKKGKLVHTFSLIPTWRFFAPNPLHSDYEILYRDRLIDETITKFKIVSFKEDRKVIHFLYNPKARLGKVLSDSVRALTKLSRNVEQNEILSSFPYKNIENYISKIENTHKCFQRQFIIIKIPDVYIQKDELKYEVIFTSPFNNFNNG